MNYKTTRDISMIENNLRLFYFDARTGVPVEDKFKIESILLDMIPKINNEIESFLQDGYEVAFCDSLSGVYTRLSGEEATFLVSKLPICFSKRDMLVDGFLKELWENEIQDKDKYMLLLYMPIIDEGALKLGKDYKFTEDSWNSLFAIVKK